jgi:hypothetical protein
MADFARRPRLPSLWESIEQFRSCTPAAERKSGSDERQQSVLEADRRYTFLTSQSALLPLNLGHSRPHFRSDRSGSDAEKPMARKPGLKRTVCSIAARRLQSSPFPLIFEPGESLNQTFSLFSQQGSLYSNLGGETYWNFLDPKTTSIIQMCFPRTCESSIKR